jgi:hypothetical protein
MLVCGLGAFVLIALCCPDTMIGGAVRRGLVEWPAAVLNNLTPRRALVLLAACLFAVAFAQAAPAEFLWIAAIDAATWLEIATAAWLLSASRLARRAPAHLVAKLAIGFRREARAVLQGWPRRIGRTPRLPRRGRPPPADEGRAVPWNVYA